MQGIKYFWQDFKTQPEIWFFYGFLLTATLTLRKVLLFFPLQGEFNEYSSLYLYLSDIFLLLTLGAGFLTILKNKINILSIYNNVPRGTKFYLFALPFILMLWSAFSVFWADNKIVSIFRMVKLLEFFSLYLFIVFRFFYWEVNNLQAKIEKNCSTWNINSGNGKMILKAVFLLIVFIGLIQAIIGIFQFFTQFSLGLFWLKESLIGKDIPGVAKIILDGEKYIRAYGLFPHPNILGGFLIFSIFNLLLYKKLSLENFWNKSGEPKKETLSLSHIFSKGVDANNVFRLVLVIQLFALILTFSKSALISLILVSIIFKIYNCSTWNIVGRIKLNAKLIVKEKGKKILMIVLILIFILILIKPNYQYFFVQSLNERSFFLNVSRETIINHPFLGIGQGQFVIDMNNNHLKIENWKLQPVHNVFLLIWSELGLIGLMVFIIFLLKIIIIVSRGTKGKFPLLIGKTFSSIFIGLLFIMFFDHYPWDIQQGSILLWITLGFLVGSGISGDQRRLSLTK